MKTSSKISFQSTSSEISKIVNERIKYNKELMAKLLKKEIKINSLDNRQSVKIFIEGIIEDLKVYKEILKKLSVIESTPASEKTNKIDALKEYVRINLFFEKEKLEKSTCQFSEHSYINAINRMLKYHISDTQIAIEGLLHLTLIDGNQISYIGDITLWAAQPIQSNLKKMKGTTWANEHQLSKTIESKMQAISLAHKKLSNAVDLEDFYQNVYKIISCKMWINKIKDLQEREKKEKHIERKKIKRRNKRERKKQQEREEWEETVKDSIKKNVEYIRVEKNSKKLNESLEEKHYDKPRIVSINNNLVVQDKPSPFSNQITTKFAAEKKQKAERNTDKHKSSTIFALPKYQLNSLNNQQSTQNINMPLTLDQIIWDGIAFIMQRKLNEKRLTPATTAIAERENNIIIATQNRIDNKQNQINEIFTNLIRLIDGHQLTVDELHWEIKSKIAKLRYNIKEYLENPSREYIQRMLQKELNNPIAKNKLDRTKKGLQRRINQLNQHLIKALIEDLYIFILQFFMLTYPQKWEAIKQKPLIALNQDEQFNLTASNKKDWHTHPELLICQYITSEKNNNEEPIYIGVDKKLCGKCDLLIRGENSRHEEAISTFNMREKQGVSRLNKITSLNESTTCKQVFFFSGAVDTGYPRTNIPEVFISANHTAPVNCIAGRLNKLIPPSKDAQLKNPVYFFLNQLHPLLLMLSDVVLSPYKDIQQESMLNYYKLADKKLDYSKNQEPTHSLGASERIVHTI